MLKSAANLPLGIAGAILRSIGGASAGVAATYGANKLTGADEWVSPAGAAEQYSSMAILGGLAGSKRIRTRMGNYINPKNEAGVRQVSPMRLALAARAPGLAYGTPLMIDAALHRMFPDDGNLRIEPRAAMATAGSSLLGAGLGWGAGSLLFPDDESLSAKERLRRQNRHLNTKLGLAALGGLLGAAVPYRQQVTAGAKDLMQKVAGGLPMNLHTPTPKPATPLPSNVKVFNNYDPKDIAYVDTAHDNAAGQFAKQFPGRSGLFAAGHAGTESRYYSVGGQLLSNMFPTKKGPQIGNTWSDRLLDRVAGVPRYSTIPGKIPSVCSVKGCNLDQGHGTTDIPRLQSRLMGGTSKDMIYAPAGNYGNTPTFRAAFKDLLQTTKPNQYPLLFPSYRDFKVPGLSITNTHRRAPLFQHAARDLNRIAGAVTSYPPTSSTSPLPADVQRFLGRSRLQNIAAAVRPALWRMENIQQSDKRVPGLTEQQTSYVAPVSVRQTNPLAHLRSLLFAKPT